LLRDAVFDLLDQRAQADNRADPDSDAEKEEQQPMPRRPHFAPGHVEDEVHATSSAMSDTLPACRRSRASAHSESLDKLAAYRTNRAVSLSSTIRPSFKLITRSAWSAST